MTFDQSLARGREREQIRAKLARFRAAGLSGFAYVSHASFVILGRPDLVTQAREQLLTRSLLPAGRLVSLDDS